MSSPFRRFSIISPKTLGVSLAAAASLAVGLHAQQAGAPAAPPAVTSAALAARPCRVHGRVASGESPLPGATVTAFSGERIVAVTSTDLDGSYVVPVAPGTYRLKFELTPFVPV